MTNPVLDPAAAVTIGGRSLRVWPEGQKMQKWMGAGVVVTGFPDHGTYAAQLAPPGLQRARATALGQAHAPL